MKHSRSSLSAHSAQSCRSALERSRCMTRLRAEAISQLRVAFSTTIARCRWDLSANLRICPQKVLFPSAMPRRLFHPAEHLQQVLLIVLRLNQSEIQGAAGEYDADDRAAEVRDIRNASVGIDDRVDQVER